MKIGELFVDLDFREGGAINKLTNFSIKFLALKTMVSQVADTFDSMFDSVIDGVVMFENLNDTTGLSIERMQKWKALAEQNSVSFEDLISSLKNLQSASADIMMGKGNAAPFTQLGIDMTKPREAFSLLNEIRTKILQIKDIGLRRNLLQEMGVSENMLILFKNFNGYYDKNLQLNEKERKAVMELNKEWIALKQTFGAGWDKMLAQGAQRMIAIVKAIREGVTAFVELIQQSKNFGEVVDKVLSSISKKFRDLGKDNTFFRMIGDLIDAIREIWGWLVKAWDFIVDTTDESSNTYEDSKNYVQKKLGGENGEKNWYDNMVAWANRNPLEEMALQQQMAQGVVQNPNNINNTSTINNNSGSRTVNVNNYITSSRPIDKRMMEEVGNSTAQQIGNVGFMSGR